MPWAIKLIIEKNPIPTPTCSLDNVLEMELDIAIWINDCPTCPKIKKAGIKNRKSPVKMDSKIKHVNKQLEATVNKYLFPFRSASLPPFFPSIAAVSAAGIM